MSQSFSALPIKVPLAASELLPQSGPMLLVDEATVLETQRAVSLSTIKPDNIMLDEAKKFPCMGLIEMMAQTIGIYAGAVRLVAGQKPQIGFLLGTRELTLTKDYLNVGATVKCEARKTFENDDGLWQFDTLAYLVSDNSETLLAKAAITVFNAPQSFIDSLSSL